MVCMASLAKLGCAVAGEGRGVRAGCLERYREKKRRRLHSSIIRYEKRKVNADNRRAPAAAKSQGGKRVPRLRLPPHPGF